MQDFMMPGKKNKRKNIRVKPDKKNPIRVDINGMNFLDIFSAVDISMSGIGIKVPYKFKDCRVDMGIAIIIDLPYPLKKSISTQGMVRHLSEQSFGIQFTSLESKDKKYLKQYISGLLKNETIFTRLKFHLGII